MATSEEPELEPEDPPDQLESKEPDQPGSSRLRSQRVQMIVNVLGVTIALGDLLLRGCGG